MTIIEVENLSISFQQYKKGFKQRNLEVISDLTVALETNEILCVVGSSGSGKSLLAHAILGILPSNAQVSGTIRYDGEALTPERQEALRGKEIAIIPQSVNFLNPLIRVGKQVQTSVKAGNPVQLQKEVFERLHLDPHVSKMYPFQLSGGMARRVLVSTAIVADATVVIADEPTPGLDPVVMKEALSHFREFADAGAAVMLITHDIESALTIADKIAVFYAGTTVEVAPVEDFREDGAALRHPYTKALWKALPQNEFRPIPGAQPHPENLPKGCLFAPRCPYKTAACEEARPEMRELRGGMVRCIHAT